MRIEEGALAKTLVAILGDLVARGRARGIESPHFSLAAMQLAVYNARAN